MKALGNAAFAKKDFKEAIEYFTKAIEVAPKSTAHVLYSNRSGSYASLKEYQKALSDAEECVKLNTDWAKGWNRKGAALFGLGDLVGAYDAYETALKKDPSNVQANSGMKAVNDAINREAMEDGQAPDLGMSNMFDDPKTLAKLAANPKTASYMNDPEFIIKLKEVSRNPMAALQSSAHDPRLMQAIAVALGIDGNLPDIPAQNAAESAKSSRSANDVEMKDVSEEKPKAEPKKEPVPEPKKEEDPAATALKKAKVDADAEKAEGNKLYKARKFDDAIKHYNKAWDLCKDITYLNNRAAAEFEKGEYEAAISTCQEAIEHGREVFSDYTLIAKAFARAANAYHKLGDLPNAIEYYNKSLTEHRTSDTLTKLRATEKELRVKEASAYVNPELADKAREEGNTHFKNASWPAAVKCYTEAIKRSPEDPRGYANRAAAYLKLMSFPEAVKDCDVAISKDKSFFKAYSRKATALLAMRDYAKCIDALDTAREIDTEHKHTAEIDDIYNKALSARFAAIEGETPEQTLERVSKDPEIASILQDPVMNSILQQAQGNPAALRDHMKNPEVFKKINLLIAAGVIRTR